MSLDLSGLRSKISSKLSDDKNSKRTKHEDGRCKEHVTKDKNRKNSVLRREAIELGASEGDLELIAGFSDDDSVSEQQFSDNGENVDDEVFQDEFQEVLESIGLREIQENGDHREKCAVEEKDSIKPEHVSKECGSFGGCNRDSNCGSEPEGEKKNMQDVGLIAETHFVHSDRLLVPAEILWHQILLGEKMTESSEPLKEEEIERLFQKGKAALEADNAIYYEEFTKNSSQKKFMSQILLDGTLNDKISSLTLLIQESPLHNIRSMDTMLGFCSKKSRTSSLQAINALKDLLLNGLLPDRKLKYFKNQNLSMMLNERILAIFYFEDYLKKFYFKILEILEKLSHDAIVHVKMQVLTYIFELLTAKPEQEFNLLTLGCNKLGDIDKKVSSKASYQLLKLEQAHPNMKSVIIGAVIDTFLKPNVDHHTTYYSVLTLNQTILKRSEFELANNLTKSYFTLFEKFLIQTDMLEKDTKDKDSKTEKSFKKNKRNPKRGKKGGYSVNKKKTLDEVLKDSNAKLFSAILTGLNRTLPFTNMSSKVYESHLDTLFKITHSCNFNTSVQALVLIHQVINKTGLNPDRYYKTLYESLLDPHLSNSSKQGIYLNLLYKSIKQDSDIPRIYAMVKRIMQACFNWLNISAVAGMLYLLMQLCNHKPEIRNFLINSSENNSTKEQRNYDPRKRDPRFANADTSSMWEINQFLFHYHPTIQAYAEGLVFNSDLTKPDLGLYTLTHFLDRFVYRNAKKKPTTRGSSIMQPLAGAHTGSLLVRSSNTHDISHGIPVNTEDWLSKKISDIKPHERFFYHYFSNRNPTSNKKQTNGSIDDKTDLDEDDVWDALVNSRPDVEGHESDQSDFDEEDFALMSESTDAEDHTGIQSASNTDHDSSDFEFDLETKSDTDYDSDAALTETRSASAHKRSAPDKINASNFKKRVKSNRFSDLPTFADPEEYSKYLSSSD